MKTEILNNSTGECSEQVDKIYEKADKARKAKGLDPIRVGFNYAKACRDINIDHLYTFEEIAACIGCSEPNVQMILNKNRIPKHITGELLWGLLEDLYGKEKRKELFCDEAQSTGGVVGKKKEKKHLIL